MLDVLRGARCRPPRGVVAVLGRRDPVLGRRDQRCVDAGARSAGWRSLSPTGGGVVVVPACRDLKCVVADARSAGWRSLSPTGGRVVVVPACRDQRWVAPMLE